LLLKVSSFKGHTVTAAMAFTGRMRSASVDGRQINTFTIEPARTGGHTLKLHFAGAESTQDIVVTF
jgi:hypothetical protein